MAVLYSPVRLVVSSGEALSLYNHVGWPASLPASLSCLTTSPLCSVSFNPQLLDAHALSGEPPDTWDIACPAAFVIDEYPWLLEAVLPVHGLDRAAPVSNSARAYWQRSASAWLTSWLESRKLAGRARVGWPVPAEAALFQLFKQKLLDTLRRGATMPQARWEAGYLILCWDGYEEAVLAYGTPRDKALAAVPHCLMHLQKTTSPD